MESILGAIRTFEDEMDEDDELTKQLILYKEFYKTVCEAVNYEERNCKICRCYMGFSGHQICDNCDERYEWITCREGHNELCKYGQCWKCPNRSRHCWTSGDNRRDLMLCREHQSFNFDNDE
jgi:hypothetical protein